MWSCQKRLEISCYQWLLLIFFQFQIEEIDLLPQFLYSDYKWLIDFSFCAVVINVLVEIFAFFLPEIYTQELNLALVWNFLVIFFSLYPLFKKHHFRIKNIFRGRKFATEVEPPPPFVYSLLVTSQDIPLMKVFVDRLNHSLYDTNQKLKGHIHGYVHGH